MPQAVCVDCCKPHYWAAWRPGARLEDFRCPDCGGVLKALPPSANQNTGRVKRICVVCGRARFVHVAEITEPSAPWHNPSLGTFSTGYACITHVMEPLDPRKHQYDDRGRYIGHEAHAGTCRFCGRPEGDHSAMPKCEACGRPSTCMVQDLAYIAGRHIPYGLAHYYCADHNRGSVIVS